MILWLKIMASLVGVVIWIALWNLVFQFVSMPDTFVNIGGVLLGFCLVVTPIVAVIEIVKRFKPKKGPSNEGDSSDRSSAYRYVRKRL